MATLTVQYTDGEPIGTLDGQPVRLRQYDRLATAEQYHPETDTWRLCSRERLEAGQFERAVTFYDEPAVLATEADLRQMGLRGGWNASFRRPYDKNRTVLHAPTGWPVRPW